MPSHRYETNIIYPPIYAGVYHASPFRQGAMAGGDFMVHLGGLQHYAEFGYKGALQSPGRLESDMLAGDWTLFKYKCNRGILFDGELPHLATPIVSLPGGTPGSVPPPPPVPDVHSGSGSAGKYGSTVPSGGGSDQPRRVILGFNCFPATVGECCMRAPEHSDAFNRTVKLYQVLHPRKCMYVCTYRVYIYAYMCV